MLGETKQEEIKGEWPPGRVLPVVLPWALVVFEKDLCLAVS